MNAGALVHHHRDLAGLTQDELARRVGLTQGALSAIERGLRRPTLGTLERVLAELGLELRLEVQDRLARLDAAIDEALGRSPAGRLSSRRLDGPMVLERLARAEPVVEGLAGAALHGSPALVHRIEVAVPRTKTGELAAGLRRLGAERWSDRWKQWGPADPDPAKPGAMRWRTLFGEVWVRLVDSAPQSMIVMLGERPVAVRPLHEIECEDPDTARLLARLRERLAG